MRLIGTALIAIVCIYAVSVHPASAAVTLETDTIIEVGEYTLTIYGDHATLESIVVNDTSVSISLENGSSIEIASAARANLEHDAETAFVSNTICSETESRLGLSSSSGSAVVTITPSGTCSETEGGTTSSGGSSGTRTPKGSGILNGSQQTSDYGTLLEQLRVLVALLSELGIEPSAHALALLNDAERAYERDLDLGSQGTDVAALQRFLILKNIGPKGQALAQVGATAFFGPLTQAALAEFQAHAGIIPAQGYFGAKTRSYLQSL